MTEKKNFINPTYQDTADPSLFNLFKAAMAEASKTINCVRVGTVTAFHPGDASTAPTVDVQLAQQQVTSIAPDGTKTLAQYPLLQGVPVYFPNGGGVTITFPIAAGDECIILFNDRDLDNWIIEGAGQPPGTARTHDFSDGMALVGIRSNPRALANISTTSAQVRSDDGETVISIKSGEILMTNGTSVINMQPTSIRIAADHLMLHGNNVTALDAGGTGIVYQPAQIDTYTTGVPVTPHSPSPPEVPS